MAAFMWPSIAWSSCTASCSCARTTASALRVAARPAPELRLTVKGPFGRRAQTQPVAAPSPTRRQERLRFLDSLTGRIYLTLNVQLDLPVLGVRIADQQLRVPIQEGSLDYRAEEGLDWVEGAFLGTSSTTTPRSRSRG